MELTTSSLLDAVNLVAALRTFGKDGLLIWVLLKKVDVHPLSIANDSALHTHLLSHILPRETFKWFLASILFGARISEAIVIRTYREFEGEWVLSTGEVLDKEWDGLVEVLDRGGYACVHGCSLTSSDAKVVEKKIKAVKRIFND